jgi:hypothetical protein
MERTLSSAWLVLPSAHRALLEAIDADQWTVVDEPLGKAAAEFLASANVGMLGRAERGRLDDAIGVWIAQLRLVIVNEAHPSLVGLDVVSREAFIARVAWHEWGHALSVVRCSPEDVAQGSRLLELAPVGVRETIRAAGYRRRDHTHEVVAEVYAMLMARRLRRVQGQPPWLHNEIYSLLTRVIGDLD